MDAKTELRLEPTFPLDGQEIQARVNRSMFGELVPWGIVGFIGSVGLAFPLGWSGFLLGIAATAFALRHFFRKNRHKLEARVISEMIQENNRSQDAQLERAVAQLQERGCHRYAAALGKFLLLKQHIEFTLHKGQFLSASSQQVDNLIDRLCSLTFDHLSKLSDLDHEQVDAALTTRSEGTLRKLEHERAQILIHVQRAYGMMYECLNTLHNYSISSEPSHESNLDSDEEKMTAMDRAIQELERENQALKRIVQRLHADLSLPADPCQTSTPNDKPIAQQPTRRELPPDPAQTWASPSPSEAQRQAPDKTRPSTE